MATNRNELTEHAAPDADEKIIENSGLCATCEDAPTCIYAGNAEHPVLECEEFTHHRADAARRHARLELAVAPAETPAPPLQLSLGLCADCRNREGCIFADPEAGVWQCEEYS